METTDELVGRTSGLEAVGAVENVEEGLKVDLLGRSIGKVGNLSLGRVLTECSEKVAKRLARNVPGALLVEERKSFLVLGVRLSQDRRDEWCERMRGNMRGVFRQSNTYHYGL